MNTKKRENPQINIFSNKYSIKSKVKFSKLIRMITSTEKNQFLDIIQENQLARVNVLDWEIVTLKLLKFSEKEFFISLKILNKICSLKEFKTEEIFLIAITSIFLSGKFFENDCISVKTVVKNLGKNAYTKKQILETELLLMKILGWRMPEDYFTDFSFLLINKIMKKQMLVSPPRSIKLPLLKVPQMLNDSVEEITGEMFLNSITKQKKII